MKISIVTASFNSAATIQDTLDSVARQTYTDVEHIIVDGASKDQTLALVRAYPHVEKVVSEPDRGIYDAMNKGIGMATGTVVGILNSDDFYTHPGVLAAVAKAFQSEAVDAVYGDLQYVDAVETQKVVRFWKAGPFRRMAFLNGWMPPHPTFFVRRTLYEKYGLFNTQLRFSADYELMLRFLYLQRAPVCYLPEVLVRMRMGGLSNASLQNRLKANREDRLAWQLNGVKPRFYTFWAKPAQKMVQYLVR